eukprot:UN05383
MRHNIGEIEDNVEKWMDNPQTFVNDFLTIFGTDGKIKQKVEEKIEKKKEYIVKDGGFTTWTLKYAVGAVTCVVTAYLIRKNIRNEAANLTK